MVRRWLPCLTLHDGMHHLAALGVWQTQHDSLPDAGMRLQPGFHFFGKQVAGLGDDHAVLASGQMQHALAIQPADIAHAQPVAHPKGGGAVLAVDIAAEQHGTAYPDQVGGGGKGRSGR